MTVERFWTTVDVLGVTVDALDSLVMYKVPLDI